MCKTSKSLVTKVTCRNQSEVNVERRRPTVMPTQSENQIREWLEECQQNDVDPSKQEFGTAGKLIKSGAGKAWNFVKDNQVYS